MTMKKLLLLMLVALPLQAQWVTNYYAAWTAFNAVPVRETDLDYSTGTHWVMFTRGPQANGTFDPAGSGITPERDLAFVQGAHAAGAKAIIGTGGWGSDYSGVVSPGNRANAVAAIVKLMDDYGYDGVDLDWEPVPASQAANFRAFVQALKAARPNMILMAACFDFDQVVVDNQQYFDQINLMTYDMSGGWSPFSWHNSAIYGVSGVGSIDASVNAYIAAGVPASKLGFGIELYAYVWNGVTGPQQSPYGTIQNTVPYWSVMQQYYDAGAVLKWDPVGQAAYYSTASQFVSMDYETTMVVKAAYCRSKGLGGVIVYDAGVGRVPGQNPEDRIMQAVKHAFLGGPALPPLPYIPPPPLPVKHSYVVYADAVQSGWWSTSWVQGGLSFSATDPVNAGNLVISAGLNAWDGVRFHTGSTWGNQVQVASDTLVFDVYPVGSTLQPTVMIEGGIARVLSAPRDKWTRFKIACPPTAFSWFYIQNNTSANVTALFDNLHFVVGSDSIHPNTGGGGGAGSTAPCDSARHFAAGFAAGVASVVPVTVHDTVYVYPPQIGWQYIHSQVFPDSLVTLPEGFIVTGSAYTASTKKVTIRGLKPKH